MIKKQKRFCLQQDLDFQNQVVTPASRSNYLQADLYFNGCGKSLKNMRYQQRGLFYNLDFSVIQNLTIDSPQVDIAVNSIANDFTGTGVPQKSPQGIFGLLTATANYSLFRNVHIRDGGNFSIRNSVGKPHSSICGLMIGATTNTSLIDISVAASSLSTSCVFWGSVVGSFQVTPGFGTNLIQVKNVSVRIPHVVVTNFDAMGGSLELSLRV